MVKVALIRGHHLSKEETLSYEPLTEEFQFTCFSTNNPWFDHSEIRFPIVTLPSVEGLFRFLPGRIGNRWFGSLDNVLGIGQYMIGLEKHLARFDIVHTSDYCHFFTWQVARAKKRHGYKLVAIHYENIPFARDDKPLVQRTKYEVYGHVDAMFAMSERAREALILEGFDRDRIFIVGNSVDVEKFKPCREDSIVWRRKYGIASEDLVILFAGRIRASKGVFELVYAAKKLLMDSSIDGERLRIVIAGRGPREQEVSGMVKRLRLDRNVLMIGPVPHSEIHRLHNIADIFTLPSVPRKFWQEQFGIVLIESMACGKPIVSTLSGSIPEVVGDCGLLVQPNDHYSLYLALKQLILDEALRQRMGISARARAENLFSTRVVSKKLQATYTKVLG